MSDPAKSASEIEDVLASIRRLVSESAPVAAPATANGATGNGKLMLTPSLRVSDPDDPYNPVPLKGEEGLAPDDAGGPPAAEAAAAEEEEDPSWGLEDRLSDWGEIEESAAEAVADAIEDQTGTPHAAPTAPYRTDDTDPRGETDPDTAELADFEPETGDVDWPDRSAGSALRDLAMVRGFAPAQPDADGPDADESDDGAAVENTTADTDMTETDLTESSQDKADPTMTFDRSDAGTPAAPDTDTDTDTYIDAAPVFSRKTTVHRADAAPLSSGTDAADDAFEVEDLGEAPSPFTFPETEDGLLDEETLRDIIAEVVREELQGAMGQRITRNVRKMVRREIRLALAAEDLE